MIAHTARISTRDPDICPICQRPCASAAQTHAHIWNDDLVPDPAFCFVSGAEQCEMRRREPDPEPVKDGRYR